MVNMQQALGVDDFNQMSNYTGQLQNQRRSVGQKQYGLGGKVLDMAAALGDAYNQYQPPETALGMMALPAKAVYGLGNMIVQDVGDKTKSIMGTDRSNPAAMNQAATDAFGLAADTMAGGGVVSRMTDMPQGAILGANVFQGGPHKYGPEGAAESLNNVFKGEGNAAYGWGRYDAENIDVGKQYREALSRSEPSIEYKGKALPEDTGPEFFDKGFTLEDKLARTYAAMSDPKDAAKNQINYLSKRKEMVLSNKGDYKDLPSSVQERMANSMQEEIDAIKAIDFNSIKTLNQGYLYKHDLPDEDIARYLDWDAPLSEQTDQIKKMATEYFDSTNGPSFTEAQMANTSGDQFYKMLEGDMGGKQPREGALKDWFTAQRDKMLAAKDFSGGNTSDKLASEYLGSHGIPGLKYFDGMSRKQTAQATIDGVPVDKYKPKNGYEEYLISKFNAGEPLHEIQKIADMRSEGVDLMKRWNVSVPEGTRNFVTWDQDVLNRMKLLERNNEDMTKALMPK